MIVYMLTIPMIQNRIMNLSKVRFINPIKALYCSVLFSILACSRTIVSGESESFLSTDKSKDVIVLDFSDLDENESSEHFRIMPGSNLPFLHTYCINNDPASMEGSFLR